MLVKDAHSDSYDSLSLLNRQRFLISVRLHGPANLVHTWQVLPADQASNYAPFHRHSSNWRCCHFVGGRSWCAYACCAATLKHICTHLPIITVVLIRFVKEKRKVHSKDNCKPIASFPGNWTHFIAHRIVLVMQIGYRKTKKHQVAQLIHSLATHQHYCWWYYAIPSDLYLLNPSQKCI